MPEIPTGDQRCWSDGCVPECRCVSACGRELPWRFGCGSGECEAHLALPEYRCSPPSSTIAPALQPPPGETPAVCADCMDGRAHGHGGGGAAVGGAVDRILADTVQLGGQPVPTWLVIGGGALALLLLGGGGGRRRPF